MGTENQRCQYHPDNLVDSGELMKKIRTHKATINRIYDVWECCINKPSIYNKEVLDTPS